MMRVLSDNTGMRRLSERYPDRLGYLIGPCRKRPVHQMPYALDNGAYGCFVHGRPWDQGKFRELIGWAFLNDRGPEWIVVPDVVGDAVATFERWAEWEPQLRNFGCPLALAVQDGMSPHSVEQCANPDVVFVGGTTRWKRRTLWTWCQSFPRVHVGRINTEKWLWECHRAGAESCDGTGWFRGDQVQLRGLVRYLHRSSAGLGPAQAELEFARTFGGNVPRKSHCTGGVDHMTKRGLELVA
jgi:hypothetical protein